MSSKKSEHVFGGAKKSEHEFNGVKKSAPIFGAKKSEPGFGAKKSENVFGTFGTGISPAFSDLTKHETLWRIYNELSSGQIDTTKGNIRKGLDAAISLCLSELNTEELNIEKEQLALDAKLKLIKITRGVIQERCNKRRKI